MAALRTVLDALLRAAFFVAAPFVLVRVATLVPITGTLVDTALALVALFLGEKLRKRAASNNLFRRAFVGAFSFDEYYRTHRPKPFLYYVFYPLFFPYWLIDREARREFLLFKSYNLLSLGVLVATSVYHFFFLFRPELGLREFVRPFLLGFAVELVAVLSLLMPLVTTVFELHRAKSKLLYVLGALCLASTTYGVARLVVRHQPIVSLETRERVVMRTEKRHPEALVALARGLRAALSEQRRAPAPRTEFGTIEGEPRSAAREALRSFYRSDESAAFELWTSSEHAPQLAVLFAEGRGKRPPVWLGMKSDGSTVGDARSLPREVRRLMKEAGQF